MGDNAFEFYKLQGNRKVIAGMYTFVPERIVCAARFDVQIRVCNTCCCKQGLVTNKVSSVNMNSPKGCDKRSDPRLCKAKISGHVKGQNNMPDGTYPIKLGDIPSEGQYPSCRAWFTMLDSFVRFSAGITTAQTANSFHGPTRATLCKGNAKHCATTFAPGGTGCMGQ